MTIGEKIRHSDPISRLLKEGNVVYGGLYCVRQPDVSDEELVRSVQENLNDTPLPITICNSHQEKLQSIIKDNQHKLDGDSRLVVLDDMPELLTGAASDLLSQGAVNRETLEHLTVISFNARVPSDRVDIPSGIRVVNLPATSYRFPTHPTPNS